MVVWMQVQVMVDGGLDGGTGDGHWLMVVWMQVQVMVDGGVDAGTGDG